MNRPYTLKAKPLAKYTDGQPYTFTITVSDQGYHSRFHEAFIIYEIDADGFTYQSKWEMIRCKKEIWGKGDKGPKDIEVVVLARNPVPFEPGCLLGALLAPLPRAWRAKVVRRLRKMGAGRGLGSSGGGQGTIYGSNDQDASDDSSSSSSSVSRPSGRVSAAVPPIFAVGSQGASSGSSSATNSSSASSSSSSSVRPRGFRHHQEVESWFVTQDGDDLDKAYPIDEA